MIFKILYSQAQCHLQKVLDEVAHKMDNLLKVKRFQVARNFNTMLHVKNKFQVEVRRDLKCSNKDNIFQINIE